MGQEAAFDNHQLRDGTGGAGFCDSEGRGGEGFPEGAILEGAVRRGDDRHDSDVFVILRFTELNRLQPSFYCVFHVFPFFVGEGALHRPFFSTDQFDASESASSPPY